MADEPLMLDINHASKESLAGLDGIGPSLALRIISYREAIRPFESIEDLINVPGISARMVETWSDRLTVTAAESSDDHEPLIRRDDLGNGFVPDRDAVGESSTDDVAPVADEIVADDEISEPPPIQDLIESPLPQAEETTEMQAQEALLEEVPSVDSLDDDEQEASIVDDVLLIEDEDDDGAEIDTPVADPEPETQTTFTPPAPAADPFVAPAPTSTPLLRRPGCSSILTGLVGAVVGVIATLLIIANINDGNLEFATKEDVRSMVEEQSDAAATLEAANAQLLELTGELATIEASNSQNQSDINAIEEEVEAVAATATVLVGDIERVVSAGDDFETLISGLRVLLNSLDAGREEATETPTPTPPPNSATRDAMESETETPPAGTRTPRPTATPFIQSTATPDE